MRAIVLSIVVLTFISNGFGQQMKENQSGLEFNVITSINNLSVVHFIETHREYDDGTSRNYTTHGSDHGFGIGGKLQLGYRFNEHWSAGIQAGAFVIFGWDWFLPTFQGYASIGGYGQYHFGERLSILGVVDYSKLHKVKPGISFGLGPQWMLGKKKNVGLRFITQIFRGKESSTDLIVDEDGYGDYTADGSERSSRGPMFELGVTFRIR